MERAAAAKTAASRKAPSPAKSNRSEPPSPSAAKPATLHRKGGKGGKHAVSAATVRPTTVKGRAEAAAAVKAQKAAAAAAAEEAAAAEAVASDLAARNSPAADAAQLETAEEAPGSAGSAGGIAASDQVRK